METGIPRVVYGSVPNNGIIDNLPQGCAVEVPVVVDRNGIQPTKIGKLPVQLAALIRTNVNVQELTVEAALTGKREHIIQAALLDPHTAAELDPDQITAFGGRPDRSTRRLVTEYTNLISHEENFLNRASERRV